MKFDETELIEFFGVLPSEQDTEEKEFFGTTIFDYFQESIHLSMSYSIYRNDFYLFLKTKGLEKPLLEIGLQNIVEIKVRKDRLISTPTLLVMTTNEEDNENIIQTVEIILEPSINVKINNWH